MQIQCERLYLFETTIQDPYFLGTKSGISAKMNPVNPRVIDLINIKTVYFLFTGIAKSGLLYDIEYGGEDTDIVGSYGKSRQNYEIQLNIPSSDQRQIEELVGKEFSIVGMKRDLSFFAIFAQFKCSSLSIDNEVQQRVSFKAKNTNAKIYTVQSFDVKEVINTIDSGTLQAEGGFDYGFDLLFN